MCTSSILKSLLNWTILPQYVAYFALKIFWAFLTSSQLCLAYPVLKVWKTERKNTTFQK